MDEPVRQSAMSPDAARERPSLDQLAKTLAAVACYVELTR